jgi:hypothetical protein
LTYKKDQQINVGLYPPMYWWRRWDMLFHAFVMALTIS